MNNTPTSDSGDPDHHFAPPTPPNPTDYHHARSPRLINVAKTARKQDAASIATFQAKQVIDPRQVLIVGVCSAGKSTLASNLKEKAIAFAPAPRNIPTCPTSGSFPSQTC